MQHFFRQLTQRFSVELPVQLMDFLIFMAHTPLHLSIPLIQTGNTGFPGFVGIRQKVSRLTAAANAPAWTGHNLNEVVLLFSGFNPFNHLPGIGRTVNNRHIHRDAIDFEAGLPDPIIPPDRLQFQQ